MDAGGPAGGGRPHLRDALGAAVLAVAAAAGTAVVAPLLDLTVGAVVVVVSCVVAAAAWGVRRRFPVVAALVAVATVAAYLVAGQPYGPIQLVLALTLYAVGRRRQAAVAAVVSVVAAVVLGGALWARVDRSHVEIAVTVLLAWPCVFVVVPALVGALVRSLAEGRARLRQELLAAGAYEERLRVAREVHDIAGHGFAVVAMQAGVALTVYDERPGAARAFLETIRDTADRALAELQGSLEVVADAPGAADVPALVDRVRAGGLPVELAVAGPVGVLDPDASRTVYRVVQEGLTNVLRHAGPTSARVAITHREGAVSVAVTDDGRGAADGAAVRGLTGLRRRVERLGGSFSASASDGGGFAVVATFPAPELP